MHCALTFKRTGFVLVALASTLGGAGCSGGNSGGSTQTPTCTVEPAAPTLISPANGTRNVVVTIGSLTVANAVVGETITLQSPGNAVITAGTITAAATPLQETASLPILAASTTYTVVVSSIPSCTATGTTATLGSFTP